VDYSFTPVLDLDYGSSAVIGERALHYDPNAVGALAAQLIEGLAAGGMAAVASISRGTASPPPIRTSPCRSMQGRRRTSSGRTSCPSEAAIKAGLAAVMPAHVIYAQADPEPAGYSRYCCRSAARAGWGSTA